MSEGNIRVEMRTRTLCPIGVVTIREVLIFE